MTVSAVVHVISGVAALAGAVALMRRPVPVSVAMRLIVGALLLESVAVALRWWVTGHPPVFGTFENTMASSWAICAAVLIALRLQGDAGRADAALLLAWAPATVAYGMFFNRMPYPLTISERSILIDVHVLLAWSAYAALLWACMLALRTVVGGRSVGDSADEALLRAAGLGFILFTGLIAVGAVYSLQLFSRFFTWEIVETLSAAAWLAYALVLHQRLFFGWRGRKLAFLVLATLPLLLATYWTWSLFSGTYHFFEIAEFRAW